MSNPIHALRRWSERRPYTRTVLAAAANLCVMFYGFYLLLWTPVEALLLALHYAPHVGTAGHEVILLNGGAKLALGCVVSATLPLSAAVAGFMRALFRGGMFDRTWILAASMPALLGLGGLRHPADVAIDRLGGRRQRPGHRLPCRLAAARRLRRQGALGRVP